MFISNLINELGKRDKMQGIYLNQILIWEALLSFFQGIYSKFNDLE